jgi:hypothetical protein
MNPQEWLREYREYKQSRYLRERDETDLQQRFDELASNLWSTDVAGNVTPEHKIPTAAIDPSREV